jgi:hypothetical protein
MAVENKIKYFTSGSKFFIKSFLIDDSINANRWGVSKDAIIKSIRSAIGKPFIIDFNTFSHPKAESIEQLLKEQEKYRVGTIIDVNYNNGYAWFIAEIFDAKAIKAIRDGIVRFVSPSIIVDEKDIVRDQDGNEIVKSFVVAHVAGVKDPAFGIDKAMIIAQCHGTEYTCMSILRRASKEISNNDKKIPNHNNKENINRCLRECLHEKKKMNIAIDKQSIAICLNECSKGDKNDKAKSSSLCPSHPNAKLMSMQDVNSNQNENNKIVEYENIIAELKRKLRLAELKQVIDRIVTAKLALGKISEQDAENERTKYAEADSEMLLNELASVYEEMLSNKSASMYMHKPSYNASYMLNAKRTVDIKDTTIYADRLFLR